MCGILCCLSPTNDPTVTFKERLGKLKHRGPDETTIITCEGDNLTTFTCGFVRNAITNVLNGSQPIEDDSWLHLHNGEFYETVSDDDYKKHVNEHPFIPTEGANTVCSQSDSYKLLEMNEENLEDYVKSLDGIFGCCSYNKNTQNLFVYRDWIGVIPLYYVKEIETLDTGIEPILYERVWISSEAKALIGLGDIHMFPPNTVMKFHYPNNWREESLHQPEVTVTSINDPFVMVKNDTSYETHVERVGFLLSKAVYKRNQYEVPWAVALSGGLDSNFIAYFKKDHSRNYLEENEVSITNDNDGFRAFHTFSIGLESSPDLKVAKKAATSFAMHAHHHEIVVTVEEALEALPDAIYYLETYDVTTVRAGVMNYLLAKYMKRFGIKVVYSGEGSDELFAGYLYNYFCPTQEHMHFEVIRKMKNLHNYDCLRCNKAFSAFAIECRVPFLDKELVNYVMREIAPIHKMSGTHPDGKKDTKHLVREAFKKELNKHVGCIMDDTDFLVKRQKDQFSDAVGKEWIETLKEHAENVVTDQQLDSASKLFPHQTPLTKEAYYYRTIFESKFHCDGKNFVAYTNDTVACSSRLAARWCKVDLDPSGNTLKESIKTNCV